MLEGTKMTTTDNGEASFDQSLNESVDYLNLTTSIDSTYHAEKQGKRLAKKTHV